MTLLTQLSHDLRTPLANLKLYAELILAQGPGAGTRPLLRRTHRRDRPPRRARRRDAGEGAAPAEYELETADPCALAQDIVARYDSLLAASGSVCEVRSTITGERRFATRAFERILINLVDNARKYAPGRIDVEIGASGGLLVLAVRDHGDGAKLRTPQKSHGVGLSIVRELARANGGGFALTDAHPGVCARATLKMEVR